MNRRRLLAGLAGGGVVSVGWGVSSGVISLGQPDDTIAARVETVDAPGSVAGEQSIPADEPLVIDCMSVTCDVCEASMPAVVEAYEEYGESVSFLSLSTDPIGFSVAEARLVSWWDDHDGQWPLGVDSQLTVTQELEVSAVPTTVLVAEDGRVLDRLRGKKTAADLEAMIEPVVSDN